MTARLFSVIALSVAIFMMSFTGCETQACDQEARVICDNVTSACVISKCGNREGEEFTMCFELLCVPDLCKCLESVGCAWQEPGCDDIEL